MSSTSNSIKSVSLTDPERERAAFRLRNPPLVFATVAVRCRAEWLASRRIAMLRGLPEPYAVETPAVRTTDAGEHGPWFAANTAWFAALADHRPPTVPRLICRTGGRPPKSKGAA